MKCLINILKCIPGEVCWMQHQSGIWNSKENKNVVRQVAHILIKKYFFPIIIWNNEHQ